MNSDGISGINIGQAKLDKYEGTSDEAALNSKGKFSSRTVRKLNNNVGSYLTRSHDVQVQQDRAQKTLNKRRISVLNDQGDAAKAATNVNHSALTSNSNGKLEVARCPELDQSIKEFLALAKDPLALGKVGQHGYNEEVPEGEEGERKAVPQGPGASRNIVNPEKFARRVQKDFAVFLGNAIKSADTPHGLERLRQTVGEQLDAGQITDKQASHLNRLISKQYDIQLQNFPAYLASLKPSADSDEARHQLASEKLAAIHEMTIAAEQHDHSVVAKHHQMLKGAALECYEDCGKTTPPTAENLFQAQDWLQRLEQEAESWLKPVLDLTSRHPEQRMEQAAKSVAAQADPLKLQLDEIPALERSMKDTAAKAVKLMTDMARLESVMEQEQSQLGQKMRELQEMRKDAGRLRRLNLAYQYRRRKNLHTQTALRETITANANKKATSLDQFNNYKQSYNGEFQTRNELREKYGESVEVLPEPAAPSASALLWKTEVAKLEGHDLATEFDQACINHHLDSLASKFPDKDVGNEQNFGTQYVSDVAREYVSAVKDRRVLPFAALRSAVGEGYISSVIQVQKAPDTSGYADIAQSSEEPLIPALRPKNSPPVNSQPEPQTTEDPQDPPALDNEPETIATLNGSGFSELLLQTLEGSQNPDVTPENLNQLAPQLEQMLADNPLPADGLEELADFFEFCLSAQDENNPTNHWKLNELVPGLEAGIQALKAGQTADQAVDAMDQTLRSTATTPASETATSDTDSVLSESAAIQVSDYIDSLFEYFSPAAMGSITREDQDALLRQLATAHEDPDVEENDLNMVAFHLNKTLRQAPASSETMDFGLLSDALDDALGQLKNKQPFSAATTAMDNKLAESSPTGVSGQNKLQGDSGTPADHIEV